MIKRASNKIVSATEYKNKARKLKKLGLIDIDLRHNFFSAKDKRRISGAATRYDRFINHPHSQEFVTRKVRNKAQKAKLEKHGYRVIKGRALIEKNRFDDVILTSKQIIRKHRDGGPKEFESLSSGLELVGELTKETARAKKLGHGNRYVVGKIGDNASFAKPFVSYKDLERYLSTWKPARTAKWTARYDRVNDAEKKIMLDEENQLRGELISQIKIVEITERLPKKPKYQTRRKEARNYGNRK